MSQVIEVGTKIIAAVAPIIAVVIKFLEKHREKIESVILRVQKDSQDGWTNEEKEQMVLDIYFKEVHPYLPWYIRILGKGIARNKIRKVIKWITEQSHRLKEKSKQIEGAVKNGS